VANLDASKIHKVLIVDLNFMGDMLMSSPVIRELKTRLTQTVPIWRSGDSISGVKWPPQIDVMCYENCVPIVRANPYVDKIYPVKRRFPLWQAYKAWFRDYDLVMQLNTSLLTNFLICLTGGKLTLGYDYRHRGFLLDVRIPISHRTARSGNRIRENLDLLERAFGWKCKDERMEFRV